MAFIWGAVIRFPALSHKTSQRTHNSADISNLKRLPVLLCGWTHIFISHIPLCSSACCPTVPCCLLLSSCCLLLNNCQLPATECRHLLWLWLQLVESMGPAYIKIAQMVSTRVDIFPPAYIKEFTRLQDNVAVFPTSEARQVGGYYNSVMTVGKLTAPLR